MASAPLDDGRPDLLSVHRLCGGSSATAYQPRDLLDGNASVRQQRDEAVPQLARRPVMRIESCGGNHSAERAPDVRRIRRRANPRGEHQITVLPSAACRLPELPLKRRTDACVMRAIYDAAEGIESEVVRTAPTIQLELVLSNEELQDACDYLAGEGLIVAVARIDQPPVYIAVQLTHCGVVEMEQSQRSPNRPTEHLPAAVTITTFNGPLSIQPSRAEVQEPGRLSPWAL